MCEALVLVELLVILLLLEGLRITNRRLENLKKWVTRRDQ